MRRRFFCALHWPAVADDLPSKSLLAEIEPDSYLADSDTLIEYFARHAGVEVGALQVLGFYKETMFPQLIELHEIKTSRKAS